MADLYGTLIGEAPTDADKAAAVAAALRRRRSYGELGILSGDKPLSALGGRMVEGADDYARQLQDTRQKDADNAQTKSYQSGQLQHMGSVLSETMRANRERERLTSRGQDLGLLAAQYRAAGTGKPPKLTVSDRRDLTEGAGLVGNLKNMLGSFQDSYAAPQVLGKSIPGARPLANTMSAMGLGVSKNQDDAQAWWAESDRLYNLFQRNKLFGATLTSNEMKAWAQANASKNMKPQQIKGMLSSILKVAEEELGANVAGFVEGGYDPEQISALTQRAIGDPALAAEQEAEGEGLTEEEAAELEALRKRFGGTPRP